MTENSVLLNALTNAHWEAAINNVGNISSVVALTAYQGSSSLNQAIAAAILSMGETHAPVRQARDLIRKFKNWSRDKFNGHILQTIREGKKVPGFGHSFYKEGIDPAFQRPWELYRAVFDGPEPVGIIQDMINIFLIEKGKNPIYPNAAIITAAICEYCKMEPGMELGVVASARIPAWIYLINNGVKHWEPKS